MHVKEGILLAHYRVLERIGEGGMSEVWRALDTRLDREVAIKLLPEAFETDPGRRARLEIEAKAIASLNHPNIVTVHSIEEVDGCLFLAMELVRGKTLDTLIPPQGMRIETLLDLAIPLCDAVSAAHEHGVTHRDLKPRNILVTDEGVVKVLDFGLAVTKGAAPETPPEDAPTEEAILAGRLAGTLAYMAPEQLVGTPPNTGSDVFSLGVVLYQMAGGRLPFRGETATEIIASLLKSEPTRLADLNHEVPPLLSRVVHACLEKNPERRIASAREVCEELRRIRRSRTATGSELPRSIAVLPFLDMSSDQDQQYFCEGIAEEILNALSRIEGLRVVSRTSSFRFKAANMDVREIGDRLGVASLLEGGVRKSGDRIRITANLIDVMSGYELWTEKYDRELRDIFAIQDEISQNIVQALKGTLSPRERRVMMQVATADVRAYDYYLRGRSYYYQFRRRGIQFALQMFSRAIEIDPSYALAYAGIADCSSFLYMNVERTEENRLEAEEASRRALDLDPDLAEAHASRALALSNSGRHDEAESEFALAEGQNPRLFEALYYHARDSFVEGELEQAIDLYRRATEVRPEDYQAPLLMAQIYEDLGRLEEAREARRRGVRLAEERLDQNPDDTRALYMGANGQVALGEREQGLAWARRALDAEPDEPMLLYNLACIYSLAGEADSALECLERAIEGGFAHRDWIRRDSNLDRVRGDPRYAALIAKLGA